MAEIKKTTKKTSPETKIVAKKTSAPKKVVAEIKASNPVAAPKAKKPGVSYIKVQQFASGAGRLKNQVQTLKGLGLNKINKIVELEDTQSIRGMINTVNHLVKIIG